MLHKNMEEKIFRTLMAVSLGIVIIGILSVLVTVLVNGIAAINLPMLTESPHGGYYLGLGGGILNAILG